MTVTGGNIGTLDNSGKLSVSGGAIIENLIGRDGSDAAGVADAGQIRVTGGTIKTANCVSGILGEDDR